MSALHLSIDKRKSPHAVSRLSDLQVRENGVHRVRPSPLTIAYVVHSFAPGGLERCAAWLANGLDRKYYRPLIISLTESSWREWVADDVPLIELHKPPGNSLRTVAALSRVLAKHQVDIVHSHSWPTLIECVLARRWSRTPYHLHAEHGTLPTANDISGWRLRGRAALMRWGLGQASYVVSVASAICDKVTEFCGFPKSQMHILPNGVDVPPPASGSQPRAAIRAQHGIPEQARVVGSIGRLAPVKAFDTLLQAFCALAARYDDLHLVLVGDGPELARLTQQADATDCRNRIHLVGHQSAPCDWLRIMDIFVNSSHSEGLSLAVLEAMGVGLPLVVTDVGDHGELVKITPQCGLVVPPNEPFSLANAIGQLAANDMLRSSFAINSQIKQRCSYSVEAMITGYKDAYASLAANRRFRPASHIMPP